MIYFFYVEKNFNMMPIKKKIEFENEISMSPSFRMTLKMFNMFVKV